MRIRLLSVIALAVALGVGASACGSSSSSSSSGGATNDGGVTAPVSSGGTTDLGSISGGSGFCGEAKGKIAHLKAQMAALATITSDPERIKKQVEALTSFAQSAEADAPSEIQGDVAVFADFLKHMGDLYAQAGYDPAKAAPTILPYLQSEQSKLDAASNHVGAWAKANCS